MKEIDAPALAQRGAWAVAAARVALGLTALAVPGVAAEPWVGEAGRGVAGRVFGRSLGGRDLALGAGALWALSRQAAEPGAACAWVAGGAVSDALDVVSTLAGWRELPRVGRWLVLGSSAGAALAGAGGVLALRPARPAPA